MASGDKIRILVAVDGSDYSQHALEWYIRVLYKPSFELVLMHCVEALECISENTTSEEYEKMLEDGQKRAHTVEEKFKEILKANNANGVIKSSSGGRPGEVLVEKAKEEGAAMIVVGSRGLSQVRKTLLGSVSDYLVQHAHCPVIVCRDPTKDSKLNIM